MKEGTIPTKGSPSGDVVIIFFRLVEENYDG